MPMLRIRQMLLKDFKAPSSLDPAKKQLHRDVNTGTDNEDRCVL